MGINGTLMLFEARLSQVRSLSSLRPSMVTTEFPARFRIFRWLSLDTWNIRRRRLFRAESWKKREKSCSKKMRKNSFMISSAAAVGQGRGLLSHLSFLLFSARLLTFCTPRISLLPDYKEGK